MDLRTALQLTPPRHLLSLDVMDLVPRLSACLPALMLSHVVAGYTGASGALVGVGILLITLGFCLCRALYQSPWPWLIAAVASGLWQWLHWHGLDDHLVLNTYWCLALGLGLLTPRPAEAFREGSRWLLVGVFGFATLWKVVAPQFASGEFFEATFMVLDGRFHAVTTGVADVSEATYAAQQQAYFELRGLGSTTTSMPLAVTPTLSLVARVMAALTLAIEGSLALVFALPAPTPRRRLARVALIALFCVSTYTLVSVLMFGWVLVLMAYCQLDDTQRRAQRGLLALLAYVLVLGVMRL